MALKNDGKRWTREDVKTLRQLARDANVPTDKIAKQLGRFGGCGPLGGAARGHLAQT